MFPDVKFITQTEFESWIKSQKQSGHLALAEHITIKEIGTEAVFHTLDDLELNTYEGEASKISKIMRPYIGIHWRMEQGVPEKMAECANRLVEMVSKIKKSTGIENVYLATDYAINDDGKSLSESFQITEHHNSDIKALRIMKMEKSV
ncbi:558_t:CDS:2 [Acaulospora colombiana]|uniref:558_t:CDS:1 n=1 Tax=Acaulospora colombiana TaxID=27376 RepID=A0ACA9LNR5_9GLOM|nr:558_t:CDS:2 [Acaulospora colombiana]